MSFTTLPSFAAPVLLFGLILVPLAALGYKLLEDRRERRAAAWSNPDLLPNTVTRPRSWLRHLPAALFLVGLALLLVGFARPQQKTNTSTEGATIVLTFDISGSMATTDVKPTRLLAARNAALAFIKTVPPKIRLAVVDFTSRTIVPVGPTHDRALVERGLPTKALMEGTSLTNGIVAAVDVASTAVGQVQPGVKRPPAAVILFSDGNQTDKGSKQPLIAAATAKKEGIPINTVSIGTPTGAIKDKVQGVTITRPTPTDPTALQNVAKATGGAFFDGKSLGQLPNIAANLSHSAAKQRTTTDITAIVVGAALVFMLAGVILSSAWFRRVA
jgi:Ca-activated chloride channel family protein